MSNNDYGGDTDGNHEFVDDDGDDDHDDVCAPAPVTAKLIDNVFSSHKTMMPGVTTNSYDEVQRTSSLVLLLR